MFFFFKRYLFLQPCASFACFVFVLKLKSQTRSSEGAFPRSGKKLDVVIWEDWFCFLEPGPALGQVYGVWRWCASRRGPPSTSSPSSSTQPEMLPMLHHPDQLFKVYCLVTNCYFLFKFFFPAGQRMDKYSTSEWPNNICYERVRCWTYFFAIKCAATTFFSFTFVFPFCFYNFVICCSEAHLLQLFELCHILQGFFLYFIELLYS